MSVMDERGIAMGFVTARRSASALSIYPGHVPETLAVAYRIQDLAIAAMSLPIGGWKVGRIAPALVARYGAERLAGPILANSIRRAAPGAPVGGSVFAGGYAAAEAEFLFEFGYAPPAGKVHFTAAEAASLVRRVHVGIEIASSPFPKINDLGPAVTISDFGNNNGLIVGPEVANWRQSETFERTVETTVDERKVGTGCGNGIPGGPLESVRFLLENLAARSILVQPGMWASSGAITGVHVVSVGERVNARFGPDLAVECVIEPARPQETAGWTATP